jgi:tetratricopeptide (TPR) repeat protein
MLDGRPGSRTAFSVDARARVHGDRQRRARGLIAAIGLAGCGPDAPPAAPAPVLAVAPVLDARGPEPAGTAAPPPSYRAALARGRALARAEDWPGAIGAFEAAVAADPGDARARSELGWAALHGGDLALAERASEDAIARATGKVKAAALYNLGRVHEARGDRVAAGAAYRASLALRPSATVAKRLAELARGAAIAPVAIAPVAVAPVAPVAPSARMASRRAFADQAAYCAAIDADARARDDEDDGRAAGAVRCGPAPLVAGVDELVVGQGAIRSVRVLGLIGDLDDVTCVLGIDTGHGWAPGGEVPCRTITVVGTDWAAVTALDSPAPGQLIARFALGTALRDPDDPRAARYACQEVVVACAVADGAVGCTAPVPIAWAASCALPPPGRAVAIAWDERAPWQLGADRLIVRPTRARAAPEGTTELTAVDLPLAP